MTITYDYYALHKMAAEELIECTQRFEDCKLSSGYAGYICALRDKLKEVTQGDVKMTNAISNTDNTIDSRDVIARIEELEAELDSYNENLINKISAGDWAVEGSEEGQELTALKALAEQGEDYAPDWKYGAQLIREDYFEEAMDEMVADCYTLPEDLPGWLTITVDYDALKQDYTAINFDGVTFLIR